MKMTTLFGKVFFAWVILSCQAGFAQSSANLAAGLQNTPNGKAIMAYYTAFEKNDWSLIQPVLADGFTFSSPVDEHIGLKEYKQKCWPNSASIKKFDVIKLIVKADEGFVTYNGWTTDGRLFRNTEYFTFKDGKIKTNECFFGPGVHYPNNTEK